MNEKEIVGVVSWENIKAKEALNDLREVRGWNDSEYNKRLDIIKSALKDFEMEHTLRIRLENINFELGQVLKIIKEKKVNPSLIEQFKYVEAYNNVINYVVYRELTETEFNLLKEYLK